MKRFNLIMTSILLHLFTERTITNSTSFFSLHLKANLNFIKLPPLIIENRHFNRYGPSNLKKYSVFIFMKWRDRSMTWRNTVVKFTKWKSRTDLKAKANVENEYIIERKILENNTFSRTRPKLHLNSISQEIYSNGISKLYSHLLRRMIKVSIENTQNLRN